MLKSLEDIWLLALPVYLAMYVLMYAALRIIIPREPGRRLVLRSLFAGLFILHLIPLLLAGVAMPGVEPRTSVAAATPMLTQIGVFGAFLIAGQAIVVSAPWACAAWVLSRIIRPHARSIALAAAWLFIAAGVGSAMYIPLRMGYDARVIDVDEQTLVVPDLPDALDGFRIGVLADMQMDEVTTPERIRAYVAAVNSTSPDVIVFPGDLVARGFSASAAAAPLRKLKAQHGVFAALGDHDVWSGRDSVTAALRAAGVSVLENARAYISFRGAAIDVAGVTNIFDDRATSARIDSVYQGTVPADSAVRVLVIHQMSGDLASVLARNRVRLVVAGHTHGGQIGLWFYGFTLTGAMLESRYVAGMYRSDGPAVYVCAGLGMSVLKMRCGVTPSVGVIRLVR